MFWSWHTTIQHPRCLQQAVDTEKITLADKIKSTWQNRKVPVYCPETITKCNTARSSQIDFANDQRKRLKDAFLQDIHRVKKKIDDVHRKRENSEEKYNEMR